MFVYELNHTLHTLVQTNGKNKDDDKKSYEEKDTQKDIPFPFFLSSS